MFLIALWCEKEPCEDLTLFLLSKVELKDASMVRGLVTQGRNGCCQQWVTRYRVLYSEDCQHWHTVPGFNVTDKVSMNHLFSMTHLFHSQAQTENATLVLGKA